MIKKKLISMLVSVTMLVGMFPMMMVSADEEPGSFTELQALIDRDVVPTLEKNYEWKDGDTSLHCNRNAHFGGITFEDGITIDAKGHGPIIEVGEGERFEIAGNGTIKGGSAENGGAVYVANGGTLILYESKITGCTATENGGAIYNKGSVVIENKPVIDNNSAAGNGGGIYQAPGASITIKGAPVIKENKPNNLYLTEGQVVTCESLKGGTIYVDSEVSAVITSGFTGTGDSAEPFHEDGGCKLSLQDGQVYLEKSGSGPNDPEFAGLSLTLDDGKFGLNIFVDPGKLTSEELASSQVTFTVPGRGANVQTDIFDHSCTATKDGKTVYGYTCYLSSVQMAEKVHTTFTCGDISIEGDFSVADYISKYQKNTASPELPYNPNRYGLVKGVSDYGYFIQPYLSAENRWSFGEEGGYARMENIYGTSSYDQATIDTIMNKFSKYQAVKTKVGNSIQGISMRLELDSSNAAIVTFTMANETAKLAVTCNYAGTTYKAYKKADGKYVIRIPGIAIQDMEQPLNISGTSGDGEEVDITITPIGYVYYALNKPNLDEDKKNAMVSLYFYWYYAERYVGQQGGN